MTLTERITTDFMSRKSYGVITQLLHVNPNNPIEPRLKWIDFKQPIDREKSSLQMTEIISPKKTPSALSKKLMSLRKRAIASGMKLLSEDEILEEVKRRRGELDNNETDIY